MFLAKVLANIFCDGDHGDIEVGFHIGCLTPALDHVPCTEWLCPRCVQGGLVIIVAVVGKTVMRGRTYYRVVWQGSDEPSWQAYQDIPAGCRHLVNQFNRSHQTGDACGSDPSPFPAPVPIQASPVGVQALPRFCPPPLQDDSDSSDDDVPLAHKYKKST